jgi:hypothetical protein
VPIERFLLDESAGMQRARQHTFNNLRRHFLSGIG